MTHVQIEQNSSAEIISINHNVIGRELGRLAATTGAEVRPVYGENKLENPQERALHLVPDLPAEETKNGLRMKIHSAITGRLGGPYENSPEPSADSHTVDPIRQRVEKSPLVNDLKRQVEHRKQLQKRWNNSGL